MKKFFGEFKAFISRGNVLDMAVGVVVATAFGKITSAIVNNILMPAVGLLFGGTDFTETLNWVVVKPTTDALTGEVLDPGVVIGFGVLVSEVINFLIISLFCFTLVKAFNRAAAMAEAAKAKLMAEKVTEEVVEEAPAEEPKPTTEDLLAEIRDLLKAKAE